MSPRDIDAVESALSAAEIMLAYFRDGFFACFQLYVLETDDNRGRSNC